MNKPVKYYNTVAIDEPLKGDNISIIKNFFKKSFVTAEYFEEISLAMKVENIYAIDWCVSDSYSNVYYDISFYRKESEESSEARYQEDLKKYAIWLSKEEERLAYDAKKLGYKLVKE